MKTAVSGFLAIIVSGALYAATPIELARVNGQAITSDDVRDEFTDRHGGHAKFLGGVNELHKFLEIVVAEKLLIQEAYELGLDQDPEIVAAAEALERQKSIAYLIKTEIDDKSTPAPDEVKKAWEEHTGFLLQIRQIGVETRQEADEIRAALMQGGDFSHFARTCSETESRLRDGRVVVGWGGSEPEWERIVFALEPGEISPVIKTRYGYELILLEARIDSTPPPFAKVSDVIANILKKRKTDELRAKWSDDVLAKEVKTRKIAELPEIANAVRAMKEARMETILFGAHILKDVSVTDEDARKYFEAHKSDFVEPEKRHVAQIVTASEAKAKSIATDASWTDLGWITADHVPPAFREVLMTEAGGVMKPVADPLGWHVIKVLEIAPKRQLSFDEVKDRAKDAALEVKKRAARERWLDKLRAVATIEIDDKAIARYVAENPFDPAEAANLKMTKSHGAH